MNLQYIHPYKKYEGKYLANINRWGSSIIEILGLYLFLNDATHESGQTCLEQHGVLVIAIMMECGMISPILGRREREPKAHHISMRIRPMFTMRERFTRIRVVRKRRALLSRSHWLFTTPFSMILSTSLLLRYYPLAFTSDGSSQICVGLCKDSQTYGSLPSVDDVRSGLERCDGSASAAAVIEIMVKIDKACILTWCWRESTRWWVWCRAIWTENLKVETSWRKCREHRYLL